MRKQTRLHIGSLLTKAVIYLLALNFLVPVLLTIAKSFQVDGKVSFEGYQELFFNCFPFYRLFWNSVIYSVSITLGALIVSVLAAFSFKFAKFPGKKLLYIIYIVIMMMPLQVMVLPNYIGLRDMGLLNTRMAIILPLIFSPFAVIVIHQYMREIDSSVVEAARLETNSVVSIITHCILPQIRVCVIAAALFVFADMWNIVEQPMLYLNQEELRTLSTFVEHADLYSPKVVFPASILFMIPVFLFYLLFHEELKEGLKL